MFTFRDDTCYTMPAHFGGEAFDPAATRRVGVLTLNYVFVTERKLLERVVPDAFELVRPEVCIDFCQCREAQCPDAGHHNMIQVSAPVRFRGGHGVTEGGFVLVAWTNAAGARAAGREQYGLPMLHADIGDLHAEGARRSTAASHAGETFLSLEAEVQKTLEGDALAELARVEMNILGWRYIPRLGGPGAELSQPTLLPQRFEAASAWRCAGSFRWTPPASGDHPHHRRVIQALAGLPVIDTRPLLLMQGTSTVFPHKAHVLK